MRVKQLGPFSCWKPAYFSSAIFVGVLVSIQNPFKGTESFCFFIHYSSPIKQTYGAQAQRNLSPYIKINVCSSRKWNFEAVFEIVIQELLHADTSALEGQAQEEMLLVLIVLQVTLSSDLNEAEVKYQPALGMSDLQP